MPSLGFEDLPNVTKPGPTYESHTESHQNLGPNLPGNPTSCDSTARIPPIHRPTPSKHA